MFLPAIGNFCRWVNGMAVVVSTVRGASGVFGVATIEDRVAGN
jgi:hypothetical protein